MRIFVSSADPARLSWAIHRAAPRLEWIEVAKAFALLAILLNHVVEALGQAAWFTNPGADWPPLEWRIAHLFPDTGSVLANLVTFLGWLGDSGPGVFILLSGFGLTWSALARDANGVAPLDFWRSRALRILPLYLLIHWGTLALAALIPDVPHSFEDPKVGLSLLGLRFSRELFFFINPSWWFIWLIIQLYVIYPWLFKAYRKWGAAPFLVSALLVTIASRAWGLTLTEDRYYWLTGMFFGSRLAEFALGMALAGWLAQRLQRGQSIAFDVGAIAVLAIPVYLAGVAASLFLPTVPLSNLLVTMGLLGVMYVLASAVQAVSARIWRGLIWIGGISFGVFLIHQSPLKWIIATTSSAPIEAHLAVAVAIVALSFPAAWCAQRIIEFWQRRGSVLVSHRPVVWLIGLACVGVLLAMLYVEPGLTVAWKRRLFALALGSCLLGIAALEWLGGEAVRTSRLRIITWSTWMAVALKLFVLPIGSGPICVLAGVLAGGIGAGLLKLRWTSARAAGAGVAATAVIFLIAEACLRFWSPIEAGRWGEYPALTPHATRIYGLKPSIAQRLQYNNYDYLLRTNSAGLAMGEISSQRPHAQTLRILVLGNAFSMPEGLEYERSWTFLLQNLIGKCLADRDVQVINGGVTGYSPKEKAPQFRELAETYRPDIVLDQFFVTEFQWMDLSAEEQLANIGLVEPPNKRLRDSVENTQSYAHLARIQQDWLAKQRHEAAPWRVSRSLLNYHRRDAVASYSPSRVEQLVKHYRALSALAANMGARLIGVYVPTALSVANLDTLNYLPYDAARIQQDYDLGRPQREYADVAAKANLAWIDLSPPLLRAANMQPYFPDSWHWTAAGHRLAAQHIAASLVAAGLLPSACGSGAETHAAIPSAKIGVLDPGASPPVASAE